MGPMRLAERLRNFIIIGFHTGWPRKVSHFKIISKSHQISTKLSNKIIFCRIKVSSVNIIGSCFDNLLLRKK